MNKYEKIEYAFEQGLPVMIILCDGLFCGGVRIETYDNHDFGFDCVTSYEFIELCKENDIWPF